MRKQTRIVERVSGNINFEDKIFRNDQPEFRLIGPIMAIIQHNNKITLSNHL